MKFLNGIWLFTHLIFGMCSSFANTTLFFQNKGQLHDANSKSVSIDYYCSVGDLDIYFHTKGITFVKNKFDSNEGNEHGLPKLHRQAHRIDMAWLNSSPNAFFELTDLDAVKHQVIRPNLNASIAAGKTLYLRNLYPYIDVEFLFEDNQFKYNYIVKPGGDYTKIKWTYSGADQVLNESNELIIKTRLGAIVEQLPIILSNGQKVDGRFTQFANHIVGFDIPNHTVGADLWIDPTVFTYGSYYGGANASAFRDVAVSSTGKIWNVGVSRVNAIPTTPGYTDYSSANGFDFEGVIAVFNASGQSLFNIQYGGWDDEYLFKVEADRNGNVWMLGYTDLYNSGGTLPPISITNNAYRTQPGNGFLLKFDDTGQRVYATFLASTAQSLHVDAFGRPMCSGYLNASFITSNAFDNSTYSSLQQGFFMLSSSGTQLVYGTYFDPTLTHGTPMYVNDVITDQQHNIWIIGETAADNLPVTSNAFQATRQANTTTFSDGFIARFNPSFQLNYCSYIGSNFDDKLYHLAVDSANQIWAVGSSDTRIPNQGYAHANNFPVTSNAYQSQLVAYDDMVMTRWNQNGQLIYSSYFGGNQNQDMPLEILVNHDNELWLLSWAVDNGNTPPPNSSLPQFGNTLPVTNDALLSVNSKTDYHLSRWDTTGTLLYGTFYGGQPGIQGVLGHDASAGFGGIALAASNCVWLGGHAGGINLPVTSNAAQPQPVFTSNSGYQLLNNSLLASFCSCRTPAVQILASDTLTFCSNATQTIQASGSNSYNWYWQQNPSQSLGNLAVLPIQPSQNDYLVVSAGNGLCTAKDSIWVAYESAEFLTVTRIPDVCPGNLASATASGAVSYHWTGATFLPNDSAASVQFVLNQPTVIQVVGQNANGCFDTVSVTVAPMLGPTTPTISFTNPTLSGNAGYDYYTWFMNGSVLGTGITFTCTQTGWYVLEVQNTNGCKAADSLFVTCEKLGHAPIAADWIVQTQAENWSVFTQGIAIKQVQLVNMLGQIIYVQSVDSEYIKIPRPVSTGMYIIRVVTFENQVVPIKLFNN